MGLLQFAPQEREPAENLKFIQSALSEISDAIVVLPEFFLGSYRSRPLLFHTEAEIDQVLAPLCTLSRLQRVSLVGSLPVTSRDGYHSNRAVLIDDGSITYVYSKVKLFGDEAEVFRTGDDAHNILNVKGFVCNVQICMDIFDPGPTQDAADNGVQLIFGPSTVSIDLLRTIHKARSLETQAISIFCNRTGREPDEGTHYLGRSAFFFPDGSERSLNESDECLTLIELDRIALEALSAGRSRLFKQIGSKERSLNS